MCIYTIIKLQQTTHLCQQKTQRIKKKWLLYDSILDELYKIGELSLIEEIKYKITDEENVNEVFKTTLNKLKNKNDRLNLLINSI